jgi:hypothetical protein
MGRAPSSVHHRPRLPALPITVVLLGMAVLGLGTAAVSYKRTRAKVRRAQANAQWREQYGMPPPRREPERTPVGASESSDEEWNR